MDAKKIIKTALTFLVGTGAATTGSSLVQSLFDKTPFVEGYSKPSNWIVGAVIGAVLTYFVNKGKSEKK